MAETKREVKNIMVDYECPLCNEGMLRSTGEALVSNPPKYPHKCNRCGYVETFEVTYPYFSYE